MTFEVLHENLRLEIQRRIDRGLISGTTLARATGFQQAHISNFLNRKRSLSLEGLDRVLAAQHISVLDLLPADSLSATSPPSSASSTQTISVTTPSAAASSARIHPSDVLECVEVKHSFLNNPLERPAPARSLWQRFVAVRVDGNHAAAMQPILQQGSVAVLDRHANTLAPHRSHQQTIYALHTGESLHLCYLEFAANTLILRPASPQIPIRLIELQSNEAVEDRIVGRVCCILSGF